RPPQSPLFPYTTLFRSEYHHIDTCFGTHHLMFAEDANDTLWTSGGGAVIGWLNTRQYLETGDYQAAQGWTPFILDTNGNGRRDEDRKSTRLNSSHVKIS